MLKYLLRRLLMILPTLLGITLLCFLVINLAPGGPVEQKLREIRFGGGVNAPASNTTAVGISEETIEALKKQYGFDKPVHIRYWIWLKNLSRFDFGESFSYEEPATDVIMDRFPISLQFGLISLILTYLVCIPLGISKAVKDGTTFDGTSSFILFVMYSIPPLMLGVLAITFLAGGSFLDIFPVGEIFSDEYESLGTFDKILDRAHHMFLPMLCYMITSFTVLTFLMKNSLLDEIRLDYVRTARAKGLSEKMVIYKHALKNALIPIVTGMSSILAVFFAGSIIIEQLFSINGIGLLGFQAALDRDYNVLMCLIFFQALLMLLGRLLSDVAYVVIDPRIDFN